MGSRFAALAGGGSAYVLVLIAGLGLRVSIGTLPGDAPWALANILRAPKEGEFQSRRSAVLMLTLAHVLSQPATESLSKSLLHRQSLR